MTEPRTDEERRAAGMATRREVLGDASVDRAVADTTPFTAGWRDFIARTAGAMCGSDPARNAGSAVR